MDVVITEWALQSYTELKAVQAFTVSEYKQTIRPDVARLCNGWPSSDPKFLQSKFWGNAVGFRGAVVHGFKMKWRNMGSGQVQIRVCVLIDNGRAYLCNAYVKDSKQKDLREIAKFKIYAQTIRRGTHAERGLVV